jgi:hypothetical protein
MTNQRSPGIRLPAARSSSALALSLSIGLAGCAGFQQGALKPTDQTAVVRASEWGKVYRGGYVETGALSGSQPHWRLRSALEVTPGMLQGIFYVYLCTGGDQHCTSIALAQVSFRAQAGHTYEVRAREQVNGSNRFWVWVVDGVDGSVVGGIAPGPPG